MGGRRDTFSGGGKYFSGGGKYFSGGGKLLLGRENSMASPPLYETLKEYDVLKNSNNNRKVKYSSI